MIPQSFQLGWDWANISGEPTLTDLRFARFFFVRIIGRSAPFHGGDELTGGPPLDEAHREVWLPRMDSNHEYHLQRALIEKCKYLINSELQARFFSYLTNHLNLEESNPLQLIGSFDWVCE